MCAMNPRLLRPLASGFNPRSISGLALWLDAADGSTLFQNSDGTTPATATSDPVGYWGDKSGNNRHATQATAANRPTITSIGSRKGLQYAASPATWLTTTGSNLGLSQPYTAFYAIKTNASGGGTVYDAAPGSTRSILSGTANGAANAWAGTAFQSYGYWKASDIAVGAFRFDGASSSGAVNNKSLSVVGSTVGTNGLSQHINVGAFTNNTSILPGAFGELLLYNGSLSDADAGRVIGYLARKWGIALAPQVSNADAQSWVNRVYANGGTVSESTANAVNTFCNAIDAASLRDRFYRLNLFCGNSDASLVAPRVPLYRGPSLAGTQYGNALDTNNNFVQGDYSETGASGGLEGDAINKYLETGLAGNVAPVDLHLSVFVAASGSRGSQRIMGIDDFNDPGWRATQLSYGAFPSTFQAVLRGSATATVTPAIGSTYHAIGTADRNSNSPTVVYVDGSQSVATAGTTNYTSEIATEFYVFALNRNNARQSPCDDRLGAYSIGRHMTAGEAASYYAAIRAFQDALGRPVP